MGDFKLVDLLAYQRNKNIFCEGIENSRPSKLLKRFYRLFRKHYAKKARLVYTERIVEYPIVFQYLDLGAKDVLDFGCVEDFLPIHLASMGYKVTGLDFRPYAFEHPNLSFIKADILKWNPPIEQFDVVISVSTIEHVGLTYYGEPACNEGDRIAIEKLWQTLRPGGKLIATVPAGKPCTERGMRIYDEQSLRSIFPQIDILRFFCKQNRYDVWQETNNKCISELAYQNYKAIAPAQGLALIVARKNLKV